MGVYIKKTGTIRSCSPLAGYSDPSQIDKIKDIPFWILRGSEDEWNPIDGSRTIFKLLHIAGANVKYTEYGRTNQGNGFNMLLMNHS